MCIERGVGRVEAGSSRRWWSREICRERRWIIDVGRGRRQGVVERERSKERGEVVVY